MTSSSKSSTHKLLNADFLGGVVQVILGILSVYVIKGSRNTWLIMSVILMTSVNIIWISFSEIY